MKAFYLALFLALLLPVTAFAATPLSTVIEERGGKHFIIKTYEAGHDEGPSQLIDEPFNLDGYLYAHYSLEKEEIPAILSKIELETVTLETQGNDMGDILKMLDADIDYRDDEGFTGKLLLDHTTIATEVKGYTTQTVNLSDTVTYRDLERNDPAEISDTTIKNGTTLKLSNIDWSVAQVATVDYNQMPSRYTAVATYTGSYTQKVPTGYITTAVYEGDVTGIDPDKVIYTVTYVGDPIPMPEPEAPEAEPEFSGERSYIVAFLLWCILILLILGVIFVLWFTKMNVLVYRKEDDDYFYITRRAINQNNPIVDLSKAKIAPGQEVAVKIKSHAAKKLFGRHITTVFSNGETVKCLIDKQLGDFWYVITMPGHETATDTTTEIKKELEETL